VKIQRGSGRNAMKCGIFAKILLSGEAVGESEHDYLALLSGLRKQFRPANCLEEVLVEKLAFLYLRQTRVYKFDMQLVGKLFTKVERGLEVDQQPIETEFVGENKEYQVVVFPKGPSPDLLIKYEANVERQTARTQDQLERIQRMRQLPPEAPSENSRTEANRAD
jgi:hypothetical protein